MSFQEQLNSTHAGIWLFEISPFYDGLIH